MTKACSISKKLAFLSSIEPDFTNSESDEIRNAICYLGRTDMYHTFLGFRVQQVHRTRCKIPFRDALVTA